MINWYRKFIVIFANFAIQIRNRFVKIENNLHTKDFVTIEYILYLQQKRIYFISIRILPNKKNKKKMDPNFLKIAQVLQAFSNL